MPVSLLRLIFPISIGIGGAVLLTGIYLGIVALAESPDHALTLFWEDRVFAIPILSGFGVQVGLFTFLKKELDLFSHAPAGVTAASGGLSTAAMVACCAHHVADVLPLVGLTAAATFLAAWKIPFMVVGLAMNLIGITIMLREIHRVGRPVRAQSVAVEATL